jgi:4-hydroxybenzoate decarboxylase subunit C
MSINNLRNFIDLLESKNLLKRITAEVDPHLEIPEIHRRVIIDGGPALLYENVKGSPFRAVSNLFGTPERVALAFGDSAGEDLEKLITLVDSLSTNPLQSIWKSKGSLLRLLATRKRFSNNAPVRECVMDPARLTELPFTTSWPLDGGRFLTLPLVYTEHPDTHVPNLGMYRIQRYNDIETGLHMQIGKGGGFHLHRVGERNSAGQRNEKLPVSIWLGGPPAVLLSAIAPLPENIPELLFAGFLLGKSIKYSKDFRNLLLAEAEFAMVGYADPKERKPEGPFGDHYGYYSLQHDFPVFHCEKIYHRKDAIFPLTVVGKPPQEDLFLGDYLQKFFAPVLKKVMPSVKRIWSYGETGFHSLTAAVVQERYGREALMSGFRIFGEGQLSLTKVLFILDQDPPLENIRQTLTYLLERCNFQTDVFIFANSSIDTLDYAGPKLNQGSKMMFVGTGKPIRELQTTPPASSQFRLKLFSPGVLLIEGTSYESNPKLGEEIVQREEFKNFSLLCLVDSIDEIRNDKLFLWTIFTRFEPARDLHANRKEIIRNQTAFSPPLLIDARMKPWYPGTVEADEETVRLVDRRWGEYF